MRPKDLLLITFFFVGLAGAAFFFSHPLGSSATPAANVRHLKGWDQLKSTPVPKRVARPGKAPVRTSVKKKHSAPVYKPSSYGVANPFLKANGRVLFVPLDRQSQALLTLLQPKLAPWLGSMSNVVTAPARASANWFAPQRTVLQAQAVTNALLSRFQAAHGSTAPVLVLALSSGNMLPPYVQPLGYALGYWGHRGPQYSAIVASGHMQSGGAALLEQRVEKMILRYLGDTVYHLPRVTDPSSVMFSVVSTSANLDRMQLGLTLKPAKPSKSAAKGNAKNAVTAKAKAKTKSKPKAPAPPAYNPTT